MTKSGSMESTARGQELVRFPALLRCPACLGELREEDSVEVDGLKFVCRACGLDFPILNGIPRMLRPETREVLHGSVAGDESLVASTAESFGYEWTNFSNMLPEYEKNFLDYQSPHGREFFREKTVLDAGCGSGRHAFYAGHFGAQVWAVDLSPAVVEVARRNTRDGGQVNVVQADLWALPFGEECFDYIYSNGVLHHLRDPEEGFGRLLKHLKPGGEIRVYLYWRPEGQPMKRLLLGIASLLRGLTTRLPLRAVHALSYPTALFVFAVFVLPYRVLRTIPELRALADRLPMRQYACYPFRVCVNDQFDRLSAPIENRYTRSEVEDWFKRAGLEQVEVQANFGWVGSGVKPLVTESNPLGLTEGPRTRPLKVLGLATYPIEAASTRFRLEQFVGPLKDRGVTLDVRPFLDATLFASLYRRPWSLRHVPRMALALLLRLRDVIAAQGYDAVLVQREAMMFGPPVVEYLVSRTLRKPMILDLDDATYIRYQSPTHGRLASKLKCFGKTDTLIRWSRVATCGNTVIAEHATGLGTRTFIIPTVVDTGRFIPRDAPEGHDPPILGWVGSHSTYPYLERLFPTLELLGRTHRFRVKITGSGRERVVIPGVDVECLEWELDREIEDFRSMDIGLYPITEDEWSLGKSGFKAIQYLSVGVPFVVSPVGACSSIGEAGVTHFEARTPDEWHQALSTLLADGWLRRRMGEAGRRYALTHFTVNQQVETLVEAIDTALADQRSPR